MKVDKSNDAKHFYCAICEARLDRVAHWNKVEKNELILKLNCLKERIKIGDRICNKCNSRARMLAKNGDIFEKTENKDNIIQNDVNDEDNMQSENADNFETINESQNECKTLEVSSSSSSNSNFDSTDLQASIYSLTKDPNLR